MATPRKNIFDKLTDKINVAPTPATKVTAEAAAKELGVSLSWLMNLALVQYLDPERQKKTADPFGAPRWWMPSDGLLSHLKTLS